MSKVKFAGEHPEALSVMSKGIRYSPGSRKSADWTTGSKAQPPVELEVVLLGASKVGKTAIAHQFLWRNFDDGYKETVEDFNWIEYECGDDDSRTFMLKLIDTSGSHEFLAMRNLNIQKGQAFILVHSVDQANSFEELKTLRQCIADNNDKNPSVIIVTNKMDLIERGSVVDRPTPQHEVDSYAMDTNCTAAMEVTAKEYDSVEKIFKRLLRDCSKATNTLLTSDRLKKRRQSMPINVTGTPTGRRGTGSAGSKGDSDNDATPSAGPSDRKNGGCIVM